MAKVSLELVMSVYPRVSKVLAAAKGLKKPEKKFYPPAAELRADLGFKEDEIRNLNDDLNSEFRRELKTRITKPEVQKCKMLSDVVALVIDHLP